MPRNSSGTYSRPAGQPVVTGTSISSTDHNVLTADIATELTDSLSRSGKGGMTAPLRVADGSAAAPTLSFTSETGTGLYRKGATNPALVVTATEVQDWTTTGSAVTGTFDVSGALSAGSLGVTAAISAASLGLTGNATVGGTLGVTGATTLGAMAANLNMNTHSITGVVDPSGAQDAATKNYIDVTAGTSAATNSALMRRDSSGRVSVATPTTSGHAATKGYVDGRTATVTTTVADVNAAGSPLVVFNAVTLPAICTIEALFPFDNESGCTGFQIGFDSSVTATSFFAEGGGVSVTATTATVNMTLATAANAVGMIVVRGYFYSTAGAGTLTVRAQRNGGAGSCIIMTGAQLRIF